MEHTNKVARKVPEQAVDSRVKPCSVVLCIGEVESYFQRKRKAMFEVQKMTVKSEPNCEVIAPEFVNVYQEPSIKRQFLDMEFLHEESSCDVENEVNMPNLVRQDLLVPTQDFKDMPNLVEQDLPIKAELLGDMPDIIRQDFSRNEFNMPSYVPTFCPLNSANHVELPFMPSININPIGEVNMPSFSEHEFRSVQPFSIVESLVTTQINTNHERELNDCVTQNSVSPVEIEIEDEINMSYLINKNLIPTTNRENLVRTPCNQIDLILEPDSVRKHLMSTIKVETEDNSQQVLTNHINIKSEANKPTQKCNRTKCANEIDRFSPELISNIKIEPDNEINFTYEILSDREHVSDNESTTSFHSINSKHQEYVANNDGTILFDSKDQEYICDNENTISINSKHQEHISGNESTISINSKHQEHISGNESTISINSKHQEHISGNENTISINSKHQEHISGNESTISMVPKNQEYVSDNESTISNDSKNQEYISDNESTISNDSKDQEYNYNNESTISNDSKDQEYISDNESTITYYSIYSNDCSPMSENECLVDQPCTNNNQDPKVPVAKLSLGCIVNNLIDHTLSEDTPNISNNLKISKLFDQFKSPPTVGKPTEISDAPLQHLQRVQLVVHYELQSKFVNSLHKISINLDDITNYSSDEVLIKLKKLPLYQEPNFHCNFCSLNFISHDQFFYHLNFIHKMMFDCVGCDLKFINLHDHIKTSHNLSFHACSLEFHCLLNIQNYFNSKVLTCLYCGALSKSFHALYRHVNICHYNCRICSENFSNTSDLFSHFEKHTLGEVLYFKCSSCRLRLNNCELMKDHISNNCSNSATLIQEIVLFPVINQPLSSSCPYCCFSFVKENDLFLHLLGHNTINCKLCYKKVIPQKFVSNGKIVDDKCITCNLNFNQQHIKQNNFDTTISNLQQDVTTLIEILNKSSRVDLSFEFTKKSTILESPSHRQTVHLLSNTIFKFSTIELEMKRGLRVMKNTLKYHEPVSQYPSFFYKDCEVSCKQICGHFSDLADLLFKCECCNFTTTSTDTFLNHLNNTHDFSTMSPDSFRCILGEIVLVKIYCNKINRLVLRCLFCNIEIGDVESLLHHVTNTHLNCKYCGITSLNIQEYFQHNTKQQIIEYNKYCCSACKTLTNCKFLANAHSFDLKCSLNSTKCKPITANYFKPVQVTPDLSNMYFCPYCPECFSQQFNLILHLNKHSIVRKCLHCQRQFIPKPRSVYKVSNGQCFMCYMKEQKHKVIDFEKCEPHVNPTSTGITVQKLEVDERKSTNAVVIVKPINRDPKVTIFFTHANSSLNAISAIGHFSFSFITRTHRQEEYPVDHLYRCYYCELHFESSLNTLCSHFISKHNMSIKCEPCKIKFYLTTLDHFKIPVHFQTVHGIQNLGENLHLNLTRCAHDLKRNLHDEQHFQKHALQCLFCKENFENLSLLYNHVDDRHYYCKACGIIFNSDTEMDNHVVLHSNKKVLFYKCLLCNIKFRTIAIVKAHIKNQHFRFTALKKDWYKTIISFLPRPTVIKNYETKSCQKCPYCYSNDYFNTDYELTSHILLKHRVVKCGSCLENFIFTIEVDNWWNQILFKNCYKCILQHCNTG